ncbi:MAG TPA: cupredoxin domain-containing protein [Gaiellaceae bacterium]|nr:cupredoxin domain-containing protein [Gaiellaceae bacterium]
MSRFKILAGLALVAVIGALGVASIAFAHPQAAAVTTVKVTATEFKFKLSTKTAKHGLTIFKVTNKGKIAHDFKISGRKTPKINPGKSNTLRVVLSKGNHKYICSIDSHAQFGMKGTFKST